MGQSIDLYSYNYDKLVNRLLDYCETDKKELVEKILLTCGNKIADRYIILNQELWDGYSCYYNVGNILDKTFKVEDTFGKIFCTFNHEVADRQELISSVDKYEVFEELGIECEDEYD